VDYEAQSASNPPYVVRPLRTLSNAHGALNQDYELPVMALNSLCHERQNPNGLHSFLKALPGSAAKARHLELKIKFFHFAFQLQIFKAFFQAPTCVNSLEFGLGLGWWR
jgi:hypothetical protein